MLATEIAEKKTELYSYENCLSELDAVVKQQGGPVAQGLKVIIEQQLRQIC